MGVQRVGISPDAVGKQKQFADKHSFDYPLLSDVDGTVARAFGVKRRVGLLPVKRTTFVIGTDRQRRQSDLQRTQHERARRPGVGGAAGDLEPAVG